MKRQQIGTASESLCLVRVPANRPTAAAASAGCEQANTSWHAAATSRRPSPKPIGRPAGSPTSRCRTAVASARRCPRAQVSYGTAYTVLPYTNVLFELQLSGRQIVEVLEDAVGNHLDRGGSDGSHPYAAGLRWHLDLRSRAAAASVPKIEVKRKGSDAWQAIDPERTYTVVTSDYLATGGDGYTPRSPGSTQTGHSVNTYLNYTQTFVDYLLARGTVADRRPPITATSA
jgi:5'-nucleotidase/UDP-sugar diphosphatase